MSIPPAYDPRWKDVVTGKKQLEVEFFPLKLLLARQRLQLQTSADPSIVDKCVFELRQIFIKNQNHPIARKDLQKIIGRRKFFRRRRRS